MNKFMFRLRVGRWPKQDDLDRVNCANAGRIGHMSCGWCKTHRAPMSQCLYHSIATFSGLVKNGDALPYNAFARHGR